MRSNKTIAESITGISYEEIKSLANNEAKSKFLGDQLRLTYVDGYKAGFDKGAEEMTKIKDAQIEKLVEALENIASEYSEDIFDEGYNPHQNPAFTMANKALENFRKEVK